MYKITLIPGDGVGPEVIDALLHILEAVDLELDYTMAYAGNACFQDTGSTIPDDTILKAKRSDATLFGAVTTVPGQKSAIITLRKELDLYANVRPVKSYPGTNCFCNDLDLVISKREHRGTLLGHRRIHA